MQEIILHYGPPPLTQQAADAALDAIDFIASVVRGYDAIDVTNVVRPLWRTQLASWYSHLPPVTRQWYANAPFLVATLRAQWPFLDPVQRDTMRWQWSVELPHMLVILDPVLEQAHAIETQESVRASIAAARQQAYQVQPSHSQTSAVDELSRRRNVANMLQNHNNRMTDLTNGLMRAMNRR